MLDYVDWADDDNARSGVGVWNWSGGLLREQQCRKGKLEFNRAFVMWLGADLGVEKWICDWVFREIEALCVVGDFDLIFEASCRP